MCMCVCVSLRQKMYKYVKSVSVCGDCRCEFQTNFLFRKPAHCFCLRRKTMQAAQKVREEIYMARTKPVNLAAKIVTAQKWTFLKNKWWNNSTVFAFFWLNKLVFGFSDAYATVFDALFFFPVAGSTNFLGPSVCKRAFHIPQIYQTYVTKTRSATIWMERCAYYSLAGWTPEHHIAQRAYHEHTSMSRLPCQVEWKSNGWIFLVSPVHG